MTQMRPIVHVITPGDHFSPSTGSAVVTVVHGLCDGWPEGDVRPTVLVAAGTYADRYSSADIVEYAQPPQERTDRYTDALRAVVGMPRRSARAQYAATVASQSTWESSFVVGHNAVQLASVVDVARHAPVLYAHNDLLRSYSKREAERALGDVVAIVAVSDYLAGRLADTLPANLRERISVVRNGVELSAFERHRAESNSNRLRVAYVGRTIPAKGVDVLIKAVQRLKRNDLEVVIAGSAGFDPRAPLSDYEQRLRRLAAVSAIPVRFLPFVPRTAVAGILASADIVVVPSRWPDPCPLTVLEGMASGAAVIASDIGGIPEIVGGAAILTRPGDVADLAEAIDSLAADSARLAATRSASLERARERDWRVVAAEFRRVLARAS